MTNNETTSRSFRPRHVSWLTIVLAILAIITFIAISRPNPQYGWGVMESSRTSGVVPPTPSGVPMEDIGNSNPSKGMMDSDLYYPYPYPNPDVPVTDTREFLKTYYNASMRTRNVQELTRRVETTVRGYGGRVDQESSSPEYGSVSFAVPQSKYDEFRAELESLVGSKFLVTNISSQNLLPQKLSIEEQQKQAEKTLADYKTARQKIVSVHTSNVQDLQSKISVDEQQLVSLRAETQTPQVLIQIQAVSDELVYLKQRLSGENASYAKQLDNADRNIKNAQDWQKAVETQDKALLDNVATVNGIISIQFISLWDMIRLYLPGYWIPFIFAVLSFISLLWDRKRFGTV